MLQIPRQLADADDLSLLARLQGGDEAAFEAIYERYVRRLYAYAQAALGDPAAAEDVTQEVFEKMLGAAERFEDRGAPFVAWLFRVLRNAVIDRLRAQGRTIPEAPEAIGGRIDAGRALREDQLLERIAERDFLAAIAGLPLAQRQVLVLRFLLGLDLAEIASALGSTPNAAANLQYRALQTLRTRRPHDRPRDHRGRFGSGVAPRRRPSLAMRRRARTSPVLGARLGAAG